MRTVDVREAKTGFSGWLAEIEQGRERIVICRDGKPIADLVPHRTVDRSKPDVELGRIQIKFDPTEELADEDWPAEQR